MAVAVAALGCWSEVQSEDVCAARQCTATPSHHLPAAACLPASVTVACLQVVARLTDGTGGFDPQRMLQDLPAELGLEAAKCGRVVVELAKERKHTTLVQVRWAVGGEGRGRAGGAVEVI